jgi:hypothetical protein
MRWLPYCLLGLVLTLSSCKRETPKGDNDPNDNKITQDGSKEEKKHKKNAAEPKTTVLKPELASLMPDFVLTADALKKEWKDHGRTTGLKYQGKTLEIICYVRSVPAATAFGIGGNPMDPFSDVAICEVSPKHVDKIRRFSIGQNLKVLGKSVSESTGNMELDIISITELEPSKLINRTAEDFAKEFEKDPKAADKKYTEAKDFVLSGRIKEFKQVNKFLDSLKLVGTAKTIVVAFPTELADQFEGKMEVEFRTSFLEFHPDSNEIQLSWGYLIGSK